LDEAATDIIAVETGTVAPPGNMAVDLVVTSPGKPASSAVRHVYTRVSLTTGHLLV
jgi:hypothetical protein